MRLAAATTGGSRASTFAAEARSLASRAPVPVSYSFMLTLIWLPKRMIWPETT